MTATSIAIGSGSIGGGDRIEPGVALAESGVVTHMGYDCLAERTLALAQVRRLADPATGHDDRLGPLIAPMAGFLRRGGRMVGNFGAANIDAAATVAVDALRAAGLTGAKVGVIRGDDVLEAARAADVELPERGCRISTVPDEVVSAHAYIGAEGVVATLEQGAALVIGGRLADASVWVGPICHELGWSLDDHDRVALATLAGHLLEGGLGRKSRGGPPLPIGYPYAEVRDGSIELAKLPGTGGPLDREAAKVGLAHEIHDPRRYLTPDVVADLSGVTFEEVGPNRVRAHGVTGAPPTDSYRVLVGLDMGWKVVGEVSFGGRRCVERANLSADQMDVLLDTLGAEIQDRHTSIHGVNAVFGDQLKGGYPADCRLRMAVRVRTADGAKQAADMFWRLYGNGGGGVTRAVDRAIGVTPALLPRDAVDVTWEVLTA
jgi:hypothetical protein